MARAKPGGKRKALAHVEVEGREMVEGERGRELEEMEEEKAGKRSKVEMEPSSSGKTAITFVEDGGQSDSSVARQRDAQLDAGEVKKWEIGAGIKECKSENSYAKFVGPRVPRGDAKARWPSRYKMEGKEVLSDVSNKVDREDVERIKRGKGCVVHYSKAEVDGILFELGDTVFVNNEGAKNFLGKIVEMFQKPDGSDFFTAQWFFYAEDTALAEDGKNPALHDPKRVFFSDVKDENPLDCLVQKVSVTPVHPMAKFNKEVSLQHSDFVYDMGYSCMYSSFYTLTGDAEARSSQESHVSATLRNVLKHKNKPANPEISLLDLYAGCGAMSTGLCSGARLAGHNLVSKWAVDLNSEACESYKHNHPETEVRNETADDFFCLIKEWQKLCAKYPIITGARSKPPAEEDDDAEDPAADLDTGVFEVEKLVGIKFEKSKGLSFLVRWKGYSEDEDTWEPMSNLEDCPDRIEEFVVNGREKKILPLPGEVDVVCGGPPCQGASGFNRFRNYQDPLADPRNHQMVVYMDIVNFLKPRFILMENVVDILKFCKGVLGRYALSRLVSMHYQAKIGLMVAGSYGLPQFRMRVFLWGAATMETLPAFPLPTHDVVVRGHAPVDWERNLVAHDDPKKHRLEKALVLQDAISDLPPIDNYEARDEMPYEKPPQTPFQKLVRLARSGANEPLQPMVYDQKSLTMNKDDFERTCQIPKKKGANFRDLEGVIVHQDKTVAVRQENRKMLSSGKPLVPDYAISFVKGKSCKPFGRLWWDETVSTVVTRAEPHNQVVLHPSQDRVLSIRENARLQGFPDYYKLFGDTKERYKQVGNAVAVPVARALGYALAQALSHKAARPDFELPQGFPVCLLSENGQL